MANKTQTSENQDSVSTEDNLKTDMPGNMAEELKNKETWTFGRSAYKKDEKFDIDAFQKEFEDIDNLDVKKIVSDAIRDGLLVK